MRELILFLVIISPVDYSNQFPVADLDWLDSLQRVSHTMELTVPGIEGWRTDLRSEIRWCRRCWLDVRYLPSLDAAALLPSYHDCRTAYSRLMWDANWVRRCGLERPYQWDECYYVLRLIRLQQLEVELLEKATDPYESARNRRRALKIIFNQ